MIAWFRTLHPLQRLAVVMWFWLIVGISGRVALSKPWTQTVMPIYLDAADRWQRGADLYEYKPLHDVYRNPPGIALTFVPFRWLPEKLAGLVWRWLGAAVFLWGLALWTWHGLPRPLKAWESGLLACLTVPFALPSLNNGQTNLIIIGFLLLGVTAAARAGRAAGVWLGLATAVKVYPAAVAMLLATVAPKRILPRFVLACLVLALVPFLFQKPGYVAGQYRSFQQAAANGDRTFAELPRAPRDLYLVLRVWATPPSKDVYNAFKVGVAVGMALLVVRVWQRTGDMRTVAPLSLGLGCVMMTVLGPATEVHTYTLLGPTAAAAVVFAIAEGRRLATGIAVLGWALLISPVVRDMFPRGGAFQALGPQPVGGMLLLGMLVREALRLQPPVVPVTPQVVERRAA